MQSNRSVAGQSIVANLIVDLIINKSSPEWFVLSMRILSKPGFKSKLFPNVLNVDECGNGNSERLRNLNDFGPID